jgi:hypothetical protein
LVLVRHIQKKQSKKSKNCLKGVVKINSDKY